MSLKKCISKKKAVIGDLITYTLVVKNEGQGDATGVAVQDTLNSGVQFQSSTLVHGTGAYNNITGEWFIGKVAKGDSAVLNITVKVLKIGLWFNIAEISKMSEKDIDSTPGNGKDGEDDIDRQCFTVPITLCTNETVLATVPKQYSGVTWYKNGQQVGSGNTYTISATGSYTYTAINGSCPASGCCPIEVTVIDCCKPDVCVPFTVKKVKP